MSTLELERAKFALEKIKGIVNSDGHDRYKTELQDLPARLHSAGLGQTVASLLASQQDENSPRKTIYGWLEEWLSKPPVNYPIKFPVSDKSTPRLIDCIVGRNLPPNTKPASYMAASREARALATWLKKFAEAFIEKKVEKTKD
jgi:CRISPR type III-B/RAMP module-associated protein Cmr5